MRLWPSIDFASRSKLWQVLFGTNGSDGLRWAYALALVGCSGWCVWLALEWHAATERIAVLSTQLAFLDESAKPLPTDPSKVLLPAERDAAAEVISRLNVDWPGLLNELERLTPREVAILEVEPRPMQSTLLLVVEARNAGEVLRYLDALNTSTRLRDARALRHDTNDRDSTRPLRFTVTTRMEGAS